MTLEQKIYEKQLAVDHMRVMIEENHRKIAEGDDVYGRQRIIPILEQQIVDGEAEIVSMKAELEAQNK